MTAAPDLRTTSGHRLLRLWHLAPHLRPCRKHHQRSHKLFRGWLELDRTTAFASGVLCVEQHSPVRVRPEPNEPGHYFRDDHDLIDDDVDLNANRLHVPSSLSAATVAVPAVVALLMPKAAAKVAWWRQHTRRTAPALCARQARA